VIGIALFTVNYFQRRLELMAVTDRLTGVANRNELEEHIDRAFAAYEPDDTPLSLIILDIDDFKEINDTYGHLTGDRIIRKIAEAAEGCIRSRDLLVRWGGDEFMILTYSALDYALNIAERIRSTVAETPVEDQTREGGSINIFVTVSCGAAQRRTGDDKEKLIARADRALYRAKEQGRNRAASMPHEEA
jgi:diguanylate cyclase (GGDEF)-like protein